MKNCGTYTKFCSNPLHCFRDIRETCVHTYRHSYVYAGKLKKNKEKRGAPLAYRAAPGGEGVARDSAKTSRLRPQPNRRLATAALPAAPRRRAANCARGSQLTTVSDSRFPYLRQLRRRRAKREDARVRGANRASTSIRRFTICAYCGARYIKSMHAQINAYFLINMLLFVCLCVSTYEYYPCRVASYNLT